MAPDDTSDTHGDDSPVTDSYRRARIDDDAASSNGSAPPTEPDTTPAANTIWTSPIDVGDMDAVSGGGPDDDDGADTPNGSIATDAAPTTDGIQTEDTDDMKLQDIPTVDRPTSTPAGPSGGQPGPEDQGGRGRLALWLGVPVLALLLAFVGGAVGSIYADDIEEFFGGTAGSSSGIQVASESDETTSPPLGQTAGALSVNEIYDLAAPAVVHIEAVQTAQSDFGSPFGFGEPQGRGGVATGSGFVIDEDGHIATNAHVVRDSDQITVSFNDDREFTAELIGLDISTDTAVLKVDADADALVPLEFADSSKVDVGDPVVAIGNPFNLDRTATVGIVSALQREIQAENNFVIDDVIQTDAAVNSGNSGGPLLNAKGQVIGINSQIQTPSGGNVGIAFAVPSNTVRSVAEDLLESGTVSRAWLGVVGMDIDGSVAENFRLPVDEGVLIDQVVPGSPADKAGLKGGDTVVTINGSNYTLGGDVLTEFDGEQLTSMRQLVDAVSAKDPGDRVKVTYYRGDKEETTTITLDDRPNSADQ